MVRPLPTSLLVAAVWWLAGHRRASANGGQVQVADQPVGPYRVTVTSSPNPLRTGTADISVIVLQGTDQLVTDAAVFVDALPAHGGTMGRYPATHQNAFNKRYYAANVRFPSAGRWLLTVHVTSPRGGGDVQFSTDVSGAVLGMTPFEFGCAAIPALGVVAIGVAELRRLLRRHLADSADEAVDQPR